MKRIGCLFERIFERHNLVEALWTAGKGKRYQPQIREFFANAPEELNQLGEDLRNGTFSFLPYREFKVRDTKTRAIHAPPFRDRVVHHAIIRIVGPVLEMGASFHSYACRQGKGHHAALRQAAHWTRPKLWYGKIDVRRYYDSIDHATLQRLLERRFAEHRLLQLFDKLLASFSTKSGLGLPIGALTSQFLGNFYLDQFDRQMKATRFVPRYLRYMDDIVLWAQERQIPKIRKFSEEILAELHLEAKNGGEWNRCEQGLPFLGFVLYPDRIRTNRNSRKRLRRKLCDALVSFRKCQITDLAVQRRLSALFSHVSHADDINWRRKLISFGSSIEH